MPHLLHVPARVDRVPPGPHSDFTIVFTFRPFSYFADTARGLRISLTDVAVSMDDNFARPPFRCNNFAAWHRRRTAAVYLPRWWFEWDLHKNIQIQYNMVISVTKPCMPLRKLVIVLTTFHDVDRSASNMVRKVQHQSMQIVCPIFGQYVIVQHVHKRLRQSLDFLSLHVLLVMRTCSLPKSVPQEQPFIGNNLAVLVTLITHFRVALLFQMFKNVINLVDLKPSSSAATT